jgi:hypothetical protein
MDKLARKYVETRDHEIIEELYKLRLELNRARERVVELRGLAPWSSPVSAPKGRVPSTFFHTR